MIRNGANVHAVNSKRLMLLACATEIDHQTVAFLLQHGANPNKTVRKAIPALPHAAAILYSGNYNDRFESIKMLLAHGAHVDAPGKLGKTALVFAAQSKSLTGSRNGWPLYLSVLDALLAAGANVDGVNHVQPTLSCVAAAGNLNPTLLDYLIKKGEQDLACLTLCA